MNQALLEGDVQAAFSAYVDRELTMSSEERAYREFVGEEDPWASYSSADVSFELEHGNTNPSIASSFWEGMKSGFMSSVRFARDAGGMFLEAGMNHRPFASVVLDQTYTPQSEYTHRMMERGTNFVTSMAGLGTSFSETYLSSWGLNDTLGLPELSWEEKLLMATSPSLYFVNQGFFNASAHDIAYGVGEIVGNPINYAPVGLAFRTAGRAASAINPRPLTNNPSMSYSQHGFFGELSIQASKPAEIAWGYGKLSARQESLLEALPKPGKFVQVYKSDVSPSDLASLTARTGDEFGLFTLGSRRIVVRGNSEILDIPPELTGNLLSQGWKWSAHTHPGTSDRVLMASGIPGDREALWRFNQERSLILNSSGRRSIFDQEMDYLVSEQADINFRFE
jgi:hypothetical protein